jgi:hypothetical protein
MLRRIGNALTFLVVAAAGFVAHRAFGADLQTAAQAVGGAADIVNTVSQNPKSFAAAAWGLVEVFRWIKPTLKPSSPTLSLLAQICVLIAGVATLFRDFFIWARDNNGFNVLKKPAEVSPGPVSPEDKP